MGNPYTIKKANMSAKKRFDRMVLRESRKQLFQSPQGTDKENSLIDEYASDCRTEVAEALLDLSACSPNVMTPVKPIDIHDSCLKKITELATKHENALKEVGRLQEENEELKKQVNMLQFTDKFLEHVEDNKRDSVTTFFTGLPGYAVFMWMVTFTTCILPKSKLLSPGSVLLIILMKLRLNLQNQDIALRFGVSATHVGQILNDGLPALAKKLAFLVQWPDKETVIKNLPDIFRETYRKCRVIIDCCEVFIERAGNLTVTATTWSNYKHNNTIKFLVGITPTGAVSFLSKAFGGRTSDKVVTQRSGFLDLVERDDQILADRGFLISEEVSSRNASLIMPDFTKGKKQLSAREVERSRKIARVRIHVERAIERIKNFKILSSKMNISLVPHADNIMTICAAITNLQPKLVE